MRNNRPHKGLKVWQMSVDLVCDIYRVTGSFPREQIYVLVAQMQRAAISVASHIAEGMAKSGKKDRTRFLGISQGSLSELDTQVEIAFKLGYVSQESYDKLMDAIEEVQMLLSGLIRSQSK